MQSGKLLLPMALCVILHPALQGASKTSSRTFGRVASATATVTFRVRPVVTVPDSVEPGGMFQSLAPRDGDDAGTGGLLPRSPMSAEINDRSSDEPLQSIGETSKGQVQHLHGTPGKKRIIVFLNN